MPLPSDQGGTAPAIIINPVYKDPITGATYVHQDLLNAQGPWAEEQHIGPIKADESFGDVESFAAYVKRQGVATTTHLIWNSQGVKAILDYHQPSGAGRCQWIARLPFEPSLEWRAWTSLASNQPVSQRAAVERLEELAEDITEPAAMDLMNLLRNLRANVTSTATTELRPDGTSAVYFANEKKLRSTADLELPSEITIAIPVLKGHVDAQGKPVRYQLTVRLRAVVDNEAHLMLRFSIHAAERVLEDVYAERVAAAQALFGEIFLLLRASG